MQRPQLVKGNMQLFSVDQQRSQALEAHAASFASFKVSNSVFLCRLWKVFTIHVTTFVPHHWLGNGGHACTGCGKWEFFNTYLFCFKDPQCWSNNFQVACDWARGPARCLIFLTLKSFNLIDCTYLLFHQDLLHVWLHSWRIIIGSCCEVDNQS